MANEALRLIGGGADASTGAAGDELNLREVWRRLKRRKLALLAPVVLITLGVFLWAKLQPPMYTAQALLHVKAREAQVLAIEGVVEELVAEPATIESELELLHSPAFLRRTVDKLSLMQDPEFAPWLAEEEPGWFGRALELVNPFRYVPAEWWAALEPEFARPPIDPAARQLNAVIGNLAGALTIEQVGRSYVISVGVL